MKTEKCIYRFINIWKIWVNNIKAGYTPSTHLPPPVSFGDSLWHTGCVTHSFLGTFCMAAYNLFVPYPVDAAWAFSTFLPTDVNLQTLMVKDHIIQRSLYYKVHESLLRYVWNCAWSWLNTLVIVSVSVSPLYINLHIFLEFIFYVIFPLEYAMQVS